MEVRALPFLAQVSSTCPTLCSQIQESEHIKVENSENGSRLTIVAARQEHCGCYTLLVENKLGSRQAQVNLTVVGESGDGLAWGSEDSRMMGLWASCPWGLLPRCPAHSLTCSCAPSPCPLSLAGLRASGEAPTLPHTHSIFLFL